MAPRKKGSIKSLPLADFAIRVRKGVQGSDERGPAFTMVLGSGFSYPLIPTASRMIADIPWWLYLRQLGSSDAPHPPRERPDPIPPEHTDAFAEFERELWTGIEGDLDEPVGLDANGRPDVARPGTVERAYKALMSGDCSLGLSSLADRRAYLRDVIRRVGQRLNWAHAYLAEMLDVQDSTDPAVRAHWVGRRPLCRTIFTTNFDPLLQRSLQLVSRLYSISDRPDALEPPSDDESDAIHLVYTHGSTHRYDVRNTEAEIEEAARLNASAFEHYLQNHGVIVIGYGGWNDTLMSALRRCKRFDRNLYWVDIHPPESAGDRLAENVVEFLEGHAGRAFYVQATADDLMSRLHGELGLGDLPRFYADAERWAVEQLNRVELPPKRVRTQASPAGKGLDSSQDAAERAKHALEHGGTSPVLAASGAAAASAPVAMPPAPMAAPPPIAPIPDAGTGAAADEDVQSLVASIGAAFTEGDAQRADELAAALLARPGLPDGMRAVAMFTRGVTAQLRGDRAAAAAQLLAAVQTPDFPGELRFDAGLRLAQVQHELGVDDQAVEILVAIEPAAATDEQRAAALRALGEIHADRGEHGRAIEVYTRLLAIETEEPEARLQARLRRAVVHNQAGNVREAIADFGEVLGFEAAPPGVRALAHYFRGRTHVQAGDLEAAIADYTAALSTGAFPEPSRGDLLRYRGGAYASLGRYDEALPDLDQAIAHPNTEPDARLDALLVRARIRVSRGQPGPALQDYGAVIDDERAPIAKRADTRDDRARLYWDLGRVDDAVADDRILVDEVGAPPVLRSIAGARLAEHYSSDKEHKRDDQARAAAERVLALEGASAESTGRARLVLATVNERAGEPDAATTELDRALEIEGVPDVIRRFVLNRRASLRSDAGRFADAIADCDAALALADVPAELRAEDVANRGWYAYESGDLARAIEDSKAALELAPGLVNARFNLGLALLVSGDSKAALVEYEHAVREAADVSVVDGSLKDVESAVAKRGALPGADAAAASMRRRIAELTKSS